jgi:AbrB family looped-hinge helix DNA binding protein
MSKRNESRESAEVLVTRRGQTTIPEKIRKKLNIKEGTRLKVEAVGNKVVFSKIPSIFDLAGTGRLTREQAIRKLDQLREKD